MDYLIRELRPGEEKLLKDFLYQAIFVPEGKESLSREIIYEPELKMYYEDFGTKEDDLALLTEVDGKVVGAIWVRIMNDYGHVDEETPSLSISLCKSYRNLGLGTAMMNKMLEILKTKGYKQVSLSVQKENFAYQMYQKIGFQVVEDNVYESIMVYKLNP